MSWKGKAINKLLPHVYHECSELPPLPPLFSCSACDAWRNRILLKGHNNIQRRDFLSDRYQCSRAKSGRGPLKVRVICQSAEVAKRLPSKAILSSMDNKVEAYKESTLCLRQSKRLKRKKDKLIHLSNENIRPQPETQN